MSYAIANPAAQNTVTKAALHQAVGECLDVCCKQNTFGRNSRVKLNLENSYLLLSLRSLGLGSLVGPPGLLPTSCSLLLCNCVHIHDVLFSTSMKNFRINSSCCFLTATICLYFFLASIPLATKNATQFKTVIVSQNFLAFFHLNLSYQYTLKSGTRITS